MTTGASNDITNATQTMKQYIEKFGFDSEFGLLDMDVLTEGRVLDADNIARKLSEMSKDFYGKCVDLLKKDYDKVELLANALLEKDALSGEDIENLFKGLTVK